jgi:hypothetical protein
MEELVKALNLNERFKNNLGQARYSAVSVLPIMFESVEPEHELERDLEALRECFQTQFNFCVYDIFKIPSGRGAQHCLNMRISKLVKHHGREGELVIVIYAGRGVQPSLETISSDRGPSIWVPYVARAHHANPICSWTDTMQEKHLEH